MLMKKMILLLSIALNIIYFTLGYLDIVHEKAEQRKAEDEAAKREKAQRQRAYEIAREIARKERDQKHAGYARRFYCANCYWVAGKREGA